MHLHETYNATPHRSALAFCQNANNDDVAVGLLKVTYEFGPGGALALALPERALPVFLQDEYFDQPNNSSMRYACDVVCDKPGTDVAVIGHAYSYGAKQARVGFRVGGVTKVLIASGPRLLHMRDGVPRVSAPREFTDVALGYENAYGGSYADDRKQPCVYDWNPIGKGFVPPETESIPLPALELAKSPLQRIGEHVEPGGLGFVPSGWRIRTQYVGIFDDTWMRERRPLLPHDFDPRFYNCVPQDQVLHPKLHGGEVLHLHHLHPEAAAMRLQLPHLAFTATFRVKDRVVTEPMVADTVLVLPDEELLAVTYRASCWLHEDIRYVRSLTIKPSA